MKKFLYLLIAVTLLASVLLLPVNAAARWINTNTVTISHLYSDGDAVCTIIIKGYTGATVSNVDVKLERQVGNSYVLVASWDDLSGGQSFRFNETVKNVSNNYVYRLSYTADVICNGVPESISGYRDVNYFNNSPV